MSAYSNRRAPNVSQYIAGLNQVGPEIPNDLNLGDGDLDFLTNAEFFDFDSFNPNNVDLQHGRAPQHGEAKGQRALVNSPAQYQFGEFQTYQSPVNGSPTGLHGQYPPQPNHQLPYGGPQVGDKRKASITGTITSTADLEETSRMAAEEDKRRRNTAASARFRVKKKQREQALEKQAKDMADKVSLLEGKVQQLEMENKWLKGLITDKNDGKSLETMQKEKEAEERKADDKTDGVGTIEVESEDVKDEA